MTDVDYTALNEQAKILYDYAYAAGVARGRDHESSSQAHEQAEKSLTAALKLIRISASLPAVYGARLARATSNMLYKMCPVALSPSLYQINDALGAAHYQTAIDLIESDIAALRGQTSDH